MNGYRKGKGKEYSNGSLIFEGEYLNGKKWNGKGKEFEGKILIFEGEYLYGRRWNGRGIVSRNFEFEYINGKLIQKVYH